MLNEKQTMKNIKKILIESNMSVDDIIKKLEISISTYNSWINCISLPTLSNVVTICEVLNKNADEIIALN